MFNSKHYIPILRWKAAEKEALGKLDLNKKKLMTPLFQILMPMPKQTYTGNGRLKTPSELLEESKSMFQVKSPHIPKEILKYWGKDPLLIDLNLLDTSVIHAGLIEILSIGKGLGAWMVPVVNFSSSTDIQNKIISLSKKYNNGLCVRLSRNDITQDSMPLAVNNFLKRHTISEKDIDLLVDFKITDDQYSKLIALVSHIPHILKWRSMTISSGAFPPDLTGFSVDLHRIPRSDWNQWLKIDSTKLKRKTSFSDYTIQHPIYKEPVRGANPSASIRYALQNQWIIMRGQGLRSPKGAGHAQYPALAKLLSNLEDFFGADFSFGDNYISEKGEDIHTKKTGTPRTWLRAGINHHLECVISQIANLS